MKETTELPSVPTKDIKPPPAKCAVVARLSDEGLSDEEIGKQLNLAPITVKQYRTRARIAAGTARKNVFVRRGPLRDRMEVKTDRSGKPHPVLGTPCHEWIGAISHGYGSIQDTRGELGAVGGQLRAHIAAWVLANGPVPEGLVVLHNCDNTRCLNVAHLSVGTQKQNIRDSIERGRFHRNPRTKPRSCSVCHEQGHRKNRCPRRQAA